jgi:hypothetical protein
MSAEWVSEEFCKLHNDTVRVERGPQIVKLKADPHNLADGVTSPHYQEGRIDAFGKKIVMGEDMHVVDYRERHQPKVWKVYKLEPSEDLDGEGNPVERFQLVQQFVEKDEAVSFAEGLV